MFQIGLALPCALCSLQIVCVCVCVCVEKQENESQIVLLPYKDFDMG